MPAEPDDPVIKSYVNRLCREIRSLPDGWYRHEADTIYFGGGTPSMLNPADLSLIISSVKEKFQLQGNPEITLEMNPEDLSGDKIKGFLDAGITRVVLGVQSLDRKCRNIIGRRGVYDIREKLDLFCREKGFARCVDIITGIPGQDITACIDDLRVIEKYRPEHISLYLLSVESGTPLSFRFIPDDGFDEHQAEIWGRSIDFLINSGYAHYEISNFSLPGFESVHNSKYWHFVPYAGFGAGAHSFTGARRYSNNMTIEEYTGSGEVTYVFDERRGSDVVVEFFMTALRDLRGFSPADFKKISGTDLPEDLLNRLRGLVGKGMLIYHGNRYSLSREGLFCANRVIYELTEDYIR